MKKISAFSLAVLMLFGISGLSGCTNSQGIPNGKYRRMADFENDRIVYSLLDKNTPEDYFLRIQWNKATWYASNQKSNECEIVKEEGKKYFVYDSSEGTEAYKRLVKYDEATKELTVYL